MKGHGYVVGWKMSSGRGRAIAVLTGRTGMPPRWTMPVRYGPVNVGIAAGEAEGGWHSLGAAEGPNAQNTGRTPALTHIRSSASGPARTSRKGLTRVHCQRARWVGRHRDRLPVYFQGEAAVHPNRMQSSVKQCKPAVCRSRSTSRRGTFGACSAGSQGPVHTTSGPCRCWR